MLRGLMMDEPLMISSIIANAARSHGDTEVVSRNIDGRIHRYSYAQAERRSRQLAQALARLGVNEGERVGTLAWNGYRHLELYYGISGMGAVVHTVNPRLFPEQIAYIVNHAEDQYVFFDLSFVDLVRGLAPQCKTVKGWVALTDRGGMPDLDVPNLLCYEDLLATEDGNFDWLRLDEQSAAGLCYTSGTTGNPKGVLFSQRSTVLHAMLACMPDALNCSAKSVLLPVVPMFHVNAWGIPYAAPLSGAKLVLPGPWLDGKSLHELFEAEGVTFSAGVPTVWLGLLTHLRDNKLKLSTLKSVVCGGSAVPPAVIAEFDKGYGVDCVQAWGMTEMSPLGTLARHKGKHKDLSKEQHFAVRCKAGRNLFGVDMKIVDGEGKDLPRDGKAFGDLLVRGLAITSGYFRGEGGDVLRRDEQGLEWFPTGDVATIDPDGYVGITDRSKDVIKSGGEWISSIDLENIAVAHRGIAEAAVIGVTHPKWDERPLLVAVKRPGASVTRDELLKFYEGKIAKWWTPDDIVFVDQLPHTATGKLLKMRLRDDFKAHKLPTA